MEYLLILGGVEILLVLLCNRNWDIKLQLDGPCSLRVDLTLTSKPKSPPQFKKGINDLHIMLHIHAKSPTPVISSQMWTNPFLRWDPEKHGGIEYINVDPKLIWKPDIILYNK